MNCSINNVKKYFRSASLEIFKSNMNEEVLALICGNLAEIYKDGISIDYAIEIIYDAIFDKTYKESLSLVLKYIKEGRTLSESFKEIENLYPPFFIGMLYLGESSGNLYKILIALKIYYEKSVFIKKEIRKATSYPKLVLISFAIFILIFLSFVIPNFYNIYESMGVTPSKNYLIMYKYSELINKDIVSFSLYFFIYIIIIPMIFFKYCIKKIGIDKLIGLNIIKKYFEYRMLLVLFIITNSKLNISYGLSICENSMESLYIKKKLREINNMIINGNTLYESAKYINIFSKYTLAIIKIREESGNIEDGLNELCNKLQENIMKNINKYLALIQPILVILLSIIISIFLIIFVLPIFEGVKNILP